MKTLVIEDSERLQRSLRRGLQRSGFAVDVVGDGDAGFAYARHGKYDAIVLDLMLPGMDGLTLLRRLRAAGSDAHVLILSARDEVDQRIEGLQLGADDYLTKPFDFEELVARLRALVRRKYRAKSPAQRIGPLRVDTSLRTVEGVDGRIHLTRHEFAILEYLLARRGRVVSKPELLERLYTDPDQGSENTVEVFVHQLRKKTRVEGHPDIIQTRRGHGYVIE